MRVQYLFLCTVLLFAQFILSGCSAGPVSSQENTVPAATEASQQALSTATPIPPTATPLPTRTPTNTPAPTDTPSPTLTPVPTDTPSPTATPSPSPTNTPTPVPTDTPSPTATPSPTDTPTPVPTDTPSPTATPSPTNTPTITPTPAPTLRRLTQGGCCAQPFFSPDSRQVLFIDKPGPTKPVGIYGVNIADRALKTPELVEEIIGFRSPDRSIVATINGDQAKFINEKSGESREIDTGGNWPRFSPDATQILWVATDTEGPYDQRQNDIWLAELDGTPPQKLLSLYGGGFNGWLPDGERVLLVGRNVPGSEQQTLLVYNLAANQRTELAEHKRIRGIELSPGGSRVAFFVDFAEAPEQRGLWVVSSNGTTKKKLDIPAFGAYRWRDDDTLLFVPMRASQQESMQLWSIDVAANQATPLTSPKKLSFSISNGDWDVSPDGKYVVFVNSIDQNIWLISLP